MSDIERRMAEHDAAEATHKRWAENRNAGFLRISGERAGDFASKMRAHKIGTTALFQTTTHNVTVGRWRSRSVTETLLKPLGRGWVISEVSHLYESQPANWMVLDEPRAAPRVLMTSPLITEAPEYSNPPELPYVATLDGKELQAAVLPMPFAHEPEYLRLIQAASRLISAS